MNNPFFSDESVPLDLLQERAFNMRWAQQPADVIPLTAADPDFPVCPAIQEQLIRYVQDGVLSYAPPEGLPRFREAVANWMHSIRQINCTADAVFATDSAASAMAIIARASLNAGDEVFIPDPVDFLFAHTIRRADAIPVRISVQPDTSADEFIAAMEVNLSPRTRMLWLCNPHNPLGVVYPREWLSKVAEWAIRHGLRILSDEIWSDIVYAPQGHVSVAALSTEIAADVVTVYGFSKNFSLAGLRVGCIVCTDKQWYRQIVAASDANSTVFGVSVLSQVAAVAALEDGLQWLNEFILHLHAQRDYVVQRLAQWPGVTTHAPQGTYVVFPCIRDLSGNAEQLCHHLREHGRVALVPGAAQWFGPGAHGHIRICFSTSRRLLQSAFDRLDPLIMEMAENRARSVSVPSVA